LLADIASIVDTDSYRINPSKLAVGNYWRFGVWGYSDSNRLPTPPRRLYAVHALSFDRSSGQLRPQGVETLEPVSALALKKPVR
jgi:hypothetical protein